MPSTRFPAKYFLTHFITSQLLGMEITQWYCADKRTSVNHLLDVFSNWHFFKVSTTRNFSCNFVSISVEILLKLWPIAMYTYLQQALPRVVIRRTQVAKRKWKLRARFSPTKENCVHQTKISTETDKGGFSLTVFQVKTRKKIPVT